MVIFSWLSKPGKAPARLAFNWNKHNLVWFVSFLNKASRFHVAVRLLSYKRRRQNVVRTSVAHSAIASCATLLSRISRMPWSEFPIHHQVGLNFSGLWVFRGLRSEFSMSEFSRHLVTKLCRHSSLNCSKLMQFLRWVLLSFNMDLTMYIMLTNLWNSSESLFTKIIAIWGSSDDNSVFH